MVLDRTDHQDHRSAEAQKALATWPDMSHGMARAEGLAAEVRLAGEAVGRLLKGDSCVASIRETAELVIRCCLECL